MNFEYIDTNQKLAEFCQRIGDHRYCALDTEFVREKTYYPLLALIQLATEQAQACIDPLAIDDFSPLLGLFENRDMLKILHAPGQDMELFYHQFDCLPKPLFDTQTAAAVLGYAGQIGYAELVSRVCGVQLDKKYTRADWSKRPLSEGELNYAMDDVRYLLQIYQQLQGELERRQRLQWVESDFDRLTDKASYQVDTSQLWKRLKGIQKLKGAALNNADQLCRWREQKAMDSNRPRRWILKDEDLIDIARFKPASERELKQIGTLGGEFVRKNAEAILKVLEHAASISPEDYPRHPEFTRLNNQQQAVADCLMAICRSLADKNQIALASVVSKKDIDQLVAGQSDSKLLSGWRHQMVGQQLQQFLQGEIRLTCNNGVLAYQ